MSMVERDHTYASTRYFSPVYGGARAHELRDARLQLTGGSASELGRLEATEGRKQRGRTRKDQDLSRVTTPKNVERGVTIRGALRKLPTTVALGANAPPPNRRAGPHLPTGS